MVVNSPTIAQKVANCTSRIAVFGQGKCSFSFLLFINTISGGLSTEVVKYLAKYGTMSVVIVPVGTLVRLSKNINSLLSTSVL